MLSSHKPDASKRCVGASTASSVWLPLLSPTRWITAVLAVAVVHGTEMNDLGGSIARFTVLNVDLFAHAGRSSEISVGAATGPRSWARVLPASAPRSALLMMGQCGFMLQPVSKSQGV